MSKVADKSIAGFVAEVRRELENWNPEVAVDLTEGLEAELMARQDEEGSSFKLGSAKSFAQELAASAGLNPTAVTTSRARQYWQSVWKSIWGFIKSMRSAWWVFRGYIAYVFIMWVGMHNRGFFPVSMRALIFLVALIVLSVMLGRRSGLGIWRHWSLRVPVAVLNILAVLLSLAWATELNQTREDFGQMNALMYSGKLLQNDQIVSFAYAYDKNGRQLPMTQLRDGNGYLLYEAPSDAVIPDPVYGVIGTRLSNAIKVLAYFKYTNVKITYEHVVGLKPGYVANVEMVGDPTGGTYVQLTVAK